MTTNDPDVQTFLEWSRKYMDINALVPNWEGEFVKAVQNLRSELLQGRFRRGFAKSILGQLSPAAYERATGWDFDTDEAFRAHLKHYWQLFYGADDPAESA
jgi:hypothetical protein